MPSSSSQPSQAALTTRPNGRSRSPSPSAASACKSSARSSSSRHIHRPGARKPSTSFKAALLAAPAKSTGTHLSAEESDTSQRPNKRMKNSLTSPQPASKDAEMNEGRAKVASRLPIPSARPSLHSTLAAPAAQNTSTPIASFRKLALSDKSNLARSSKPASTGPSRPSQLAAAAPRASTTLQRAASQPPSGATQPAFPPRYDQRQGSSLAVGVSRTFPALQVYNDASGSLLPPQHPRPSPRPFSTIQNSRTTQPLPPLPRSPAQGSSRFRQSLLPSFSHTRARSLSPARSGSRATHPIFRYTITQFDTPPIDRPSSPFPLETERWGKEDEGARMNSKIMLETYEEGQVTVGEESRMADETQEMQEGAVEEVAQAASVHKEAGPNTVVGAMDDVDQTLQPGHVSDMPDAMVDTFDERALPSASVAAAAAFDELPHQASPSSSLDLPSPPARLKTLRGAPPPSHPSLYSATFMPPRRPRPVLPAVPSSSSTSAQPASSEDDLAYLIRTTGTYSSEDDLPFASSASLSSDESEFQRAEREVGRALKPSSGQREKRIALAAAKSRAGVRGLKIGEGKGGRRRRWRREILSQRKGGGGGSEGEGRTSEDELWLKGATGVWAGVEKKKGGGRVAKADGDET
ncbi:hypothetical protein JCM5296_003296 [Sporobolomyces johnsonii]